MIFDEPHQERPPDPVLRCLLVGGPADGRVKSEWSGAQRVVVSANTASAQAANFAIYRRSHPEIRTRDGSIEFHFFNLHTPPT